MKLTVRAGFWFARKGVTRLVWLDNSRMRTAAYARIRYVDRPSVGLTAADGKIEAICFSGTVRARQFGAPPRAKWYVDPRPAGIDTDRSRAEGPSGRCCGRRLT
jgi:hypothetical protein